MLERVVVKEVWGTADHFTVGDGVNLVAYNLTLEDGRKARINQKPETDPPTPGLVLEADVFPPAEGKKMWKVKGAKRLSHEFDYTRSQSTRQPSLQPVSNYEVQDLTQRLIIRQNALNRATEYAIASKKFEVLDDDPRPGLSMETVIETRVDYFESLIWKAASKSHELKVLEWAELVPAGGETTSEVPTDPSQDASPPAGAGPPAEGIHKVAAPQSVPAPDRGTDSPGGSPKEGGGATASPSTLAQVLRNKRQHNVPDLVFSTFLTSMGVENVNLLSEDEAQLVLAWIANGDGQVAA